ncbi:MAG: hypothetical protein ABW221_17000 [Vicinamibacteria bacterium]
MTARPAQARALLAPVLVALALRAACLYATDRVVVDVLRYQKVAAHLLDVSWNPYQAERLYPYPPVWMWVEAASLSLARATGVSFALLVRLPVLAAELGLVVLLGRMAGARAAWLYALHPVALLVSACHGQFDAIALLAVLLALRARSAGRLDAAALWLAAATGLKSFPVLLLPAFLLSVAGTRARLRFASLATVPVAVALLPFAWADAGALRRELFGYGGVVDFGWIAAVRALRLLSSGVLLRGEAVHWAAWVLAAKVAFLAACAALFAWWWRRGRAPSLPAACLLVLLAFLVLYGALSAQYLLWVVPLGVLLPSRAFVAYGAVSAAALVAFYLFLAPAVLLPPGVVFDRSAAGAVWAVGVCLQWLVTAAWGAFLLRRETAAA